MAVNETRYRSHDGSTTHETELRGDYDITWAEEASRKAALSLVADVPMVKDIGDGRSGIAYADAAQVLMQFVGSVWLGLDESFEGLLSNFAKPFRCNHHLISSKLS